MPELKDKVVIVTGGARGIGKACCRAFAAEGANIVFTYNSSEKEALELKTELEKTGGKAVFVKADVREFDQCKKVVEETLKEFQQIDIVVNNAGITRDKALAMMEPSDWKDVIDTNLGGTYNICRAAIYTLFKQKSGCIINISSVSGITGLPRQTNYSSSKAGIIGLTKALAKEVAGYGVRVNCVCPGFIQTDMVSGMKEELKDTFMKTIPLKRFGKAEEVANLCVYLASEKASYITGEIIKIDGGLAI